MAIVIIVLSAVILVSFGNQTALADSQSSAEALARAQAALECAQAQARKDFKLVAVSVLQENCPALASDSFYTVTVAVTQTDYAVRQITTTVAWQAEYGRTLSVQLSTLVANFENAIGGDTCSSNLVGNWSMPLVANGVTDFAQLVGDSAGTYPLTDVDAYQGKVYVTVNNTSANTAETFFVFDATNPLNPTLVSKIDNDIAQAAGLKAVQTDGHYAYVASGRGIPSTSDPTFGQLHIIDVSVNPVQVVKTLKISGVTGTSGQGVGNSLFYKDGYVYLGLTKTGSGPEFHIIDVHNPLNPFLVGGYSVGNDVNAIFVKGRYVYLATPNDEEFTILDVGNPSSPQRVGGFNAPGGEPGLSLALVGDEAYVGRAYSSDGELYVLNVASPAAVAELGHQDIGSDNQASAKGLLVRDNLAFVTTSESLRIWDVATAGSMAERAVVPLPNSGDTLDTTLDCEDNYLFIASVPTTGASAKRGTLSVVTALP